MTDAPAGWYPDSTTPGQQRYWDGQQWTDHLAPLAPTPYPGFPAAGYGAAQPTAAYAHWGLRLGAYVLDALCAAPFYIVAIIGLSMHTTSVDTYGYQSTQISGAGLAVAAIGYLGALAVIIWNLFVRQGRTGYSLGKQVVGIKLVKEATGQPLGGGLTFGRYLLHILDGLPCYLGYLWPLWDAKKQTFADKLVSSVVIVEPKPKA